MITNHTFEINLYLSCLVRGIYKKPPYGGMKGLTMNINATQMYLKSLEISHFRMINEMHLDFVPGVNMIIGQNGTGKSNILALLTSGSGIGRSSLMPQYHDYFKIDDTEDFANYSGESIYEDKNTDESFSIRLSFKDDGDPKVVPEILFPSKWQQPEQKFSKKTDNRVAHIVPRLEPTADVDTTVNSAITRFNNFFNVRSSGSKKIPVPTKFVSVSRIIPRGEADLTVKRTSLGSEKDNYIDWYNGVISKSISVNENSGYKIKKAVDKSKIEMPITDTPASGVSVGQDSLSTIISSLIELDRESNKDDYKGAILAIDEFDLSLHAAAQIKLLDLLIDLSKNLKIQIFITTHSLAAVKYFSKKVNRHPDFHSLTYIYDRLNPYSDQSHDFSAIATSMYSQANIAKPLITMYTEDESGMDLFNMLKETYSEKFLNLPTQNFDMIPMKVGKSTLKYLSGSNNRSSGRDEHFKKSLIVYDGDARYSSSSNPEKNATSPEFILGKDKLPNTDKIDVGINATVLPSGFAPEALIYFWLHKLVKDTTSLSRDFWRFASSNNSEIERVRYLDEFAFSEEEATTKYLKEHKKKQLLVFAKKSRLFSFLKDYDSQDDDILEFRKSVDAFITQFEFAMNMVIERHANDAF